MVSVTFSHQLLK